MRAEIERVFPGEGAGLDRFLSAEAMRFEKLYPCLQKDYGSPFAFLSKTLLTALPHIAMPANRCTTSSPPTSGPKNSASPSPSSQSTSACRPGTVPASSP